MNRVELVSQLNFEPHLKLSAHFRNAFVNCLNIQEACESLDLNFSQSSSLRNAVLGRIYADMKIEFGECHETLINTLSSRIFDTHCPNRSLVGYCLDYLLEATSPTYYEDTMSRFLLSPYISIRRRALNRLVESWDLRFEAPFISSWMTYHDRLGLGLVIKNLSWQFLIQNLAELEIHINRHNSYKLRALLYERTYPECRANLSNLAKSDGISYAYACAQIGVKLGEDEIAKLLNKYQSDSRFGVLIWSIGEMKHWGLLEKAYISYKTQRISK